ncbi:MAG: rod shape-determining protein MreC [Thermoanaerobaculia bacterium]
MTPRRTRLLLAVLLVGQLFLVASQTQERGGERSVLESLVLRALGPLARGVERLAAGGRSLGEGLRTRSALAAENRRLKSELALLRRLELRVGALEGEANALAGALAYSRRTGAKLRPTEIVYADYGSWLRTLIVWTGAPPARHNQAVVADDGIVGRVIEVAGGYAKVQLVTDRAASVGIELERAHRQGILRGSNAGRLEIDLVPLQVDVAPGDRVTTAGIDGVFPAGLPVGTVESVSPGSEIFHHITVVPAVDFARLDFVYLLDGDLPPASLGGKP